MGGTVLLKGHREVETHFPVVSAIINSGINLSADRQIQLYRAQLLYYFTDAPDS